MKKAGYEYRVEKLQGKMASYLQQFDFTSILYSTPNNPAWFCFNEQELEIIGRPATKHDCIVVEDLADIFSAISLTTTGSDRHEGLRACVSQGRIDSMILKHG